MLLLKGHVQARPFLDISNLVDSQGSVEQGLLGLAFSPDYAQNGLFYVDYTVAGNDIRVVQYQRSASNANLANPASARLVLAIDHHLYTNHKAGQLARGLAGHYLAGNNLFRSYASERSKLASGPIRAASYPYWRVWWARDPVRGLLVVGARDGLRPQRGDPHRVPDVRRG